MQAAPQSHASATDRKVLIAFACVYIFWGSTFLGIRIAVGHFPPLLVSGLRFLMAAPVVFAIAWMRGRRLRASRTELGQLLVTGVLLLVGGNVLLVWSEKTLDSGFASLVVASIPILMTLLEVILPGGQGLSPIGWAGMMTGFAGLTVLLWPTLSAGHSESGRALGCIVLIFGSFCWALGSVVSKRIKFGMDPFVVSAWQMLIAGSVNVLAGTVVGEWRLVDWNQSGVLAIVYLAIFGSIVGFGSYTYLLHHAPVARVATYAYVNPIVAILLGAVFLRERLRPMEWLGTAIILTSVAVVNTSKLRPVRRKEAEAAMELPQEG